MNNNKSILRDVAEAVQNEHDLEKAKQIVINRVQRSKINDKDKRFMLMRVQHQIFTHDKLVSFVYNNILKFEGNGVLGKQKYA